MDANDFLVMAGRLTLAQGSGPADYRTAISRAYYAVHHLARRVLIEQMKFVCHDDNEHRWVQRHFYNCQIPQVRDVGRLLGNLHEARKNADYDLDDLNIETMVQARFQLERATEIKSRLQYCTDAANLESIKAEMMDYRARANVR